MSWENRSWLSMRARQPCGRGSWRTDGFIRRRSYGRALRSNNSWIRCVRHSAPEPNGRSGAAQESNLPTAGLRRLTGFEDRLGHQPRAAPRGRLDGRAQAASIPQGTRKEAPRALWDNLPMQPILDIADLAQRREAAEATADGAALFYAFGNFCALAAQARSGVAAGDERAQGAAARTRSAASRRRRRRRAGCSTGTRCSCRGARWSRPWPTCTRSGRSASAGPAAAHIPRHLTVDRRTVQLISPGDACPSNALVGEVLDLIGEDILYITSANTSSHASRGALRDARDPEGVRAPAGRRR